LGKDKFLIIKISRNKVRPFFGFGKKFCDLFNAFTKGTGTYYFVALASNRSGGVLSKSQIPGQISNGSLSFSEEQEQYKFNNYNLKDQDSFFSTNGFLKRVGMTG
jgi:hypothetical protein